MKQQVVDVTYVSVWDGGYEIRSKAKYDTATKKVSDIEVVEGSGDTVEHLDEEYIEMPDGSRKEVFDMGTHYEAD